MEESPPRGRKPLTVKDWSEETTKLALKVNPATLLKWIHCYNASGSGRVSHEGIEDTWLRWCDERGNVILSGAEASRAANLRNEKLAAKLREMGVNPDNI